MTYYEYEIQGNYGYSWERLTSEETKSNALEMLKCYNDNELGVPHRIRKVRK